MAVAMTWYDRIKGFYDKGLWSIEWVADAVGANRITAEQFETITGQNYHEFVAVDA